MNTIQARPRQLAGLVLLLWVVSLLLLTRGPGLLSPRHPYQVTGRDALVPCSNPANLQDWGRDVCGDRPADRAPGQATGCILDTNHYFNTSAAAFDIADPLSCNFFMEDWSRASCGVEWDMQLLVKQLVRE